MFNSIGYILSKYLLCCCMKQSKIKSYEKKFTLNVEKAPEPEDVIWENLQFNSKHRFFRKLMVYLISLVLIAISFGIIVGLNYGQVN